MKKKMIALFLSAAMILGVVGCGKKDEEVVDESATVQEEIVKFVNEDLPALASDRDNAVNIYNQYFEDGSDQDSETWRKKLEDEALVSYNTYIDNLNALEYNNAEVVNLRDIFVKSASSQRDAIEYVDEAIANLDSTKLGDAAQCISDSNTYLNMYQDELQRLCDKYGIEIIGEFQDTSTLTDASVSDASSTDAD